ncbi:MAG: glycosyltransferase, partial [Planctomycetota bacterium]|nr:glycosyltransferase [Planctomycetota bacterium]
MSPTKPVVIVFSERLDNEPITASIVRELSATHEVRACGPGWPVERLEDVDPNGARFYLELDAVTGNFVRPTGLERLAVPKFAWLVDTHKKPLFHRELARELDLTFHAHRAWGHVFEGPRAWLPLHADGELFRPVDVPDAEREWDVVFVGSQTWRADVLQRLAERHGLRVLVTTTTGPGEKTKTAEIYARARLVFNQHVANDLNFRVFEALASGRVLLTDAQNNGQYELFEDGRHLVLYKNEQDLERQVLRLLGDEALRRRIEQEAAAVAHAQHTTRARVKQLLAAIDAFLGGAATDPAAPTGGGVLVPTTPAPPASAAPPPCASRPTRRVLLLAADEAPNVAIQSYGEALASGLAARGHEVVVFRRRRGPFGPPPARPGAPTVLELDPGPLPRALTPEDDVLMAAAPAHVQVDRAVREHGPFDVVLAEGPLAHHVGPALRQRTGLPLILLLPEHEVARNGDALNRAQLYRAELEHWACERSDLVVAASAAVAEAAQRVYHAQEPLVVGWPTAAVPPPSTENLARFAARLGLPTRFALVLGRALGAELRRSLSAQGQVVVADLGAADDVADVGLVLPDGRELGRQAVRGPALAALLVLAEAVVVEDPQDPRRADAERLAARLAVGNVRGPGDLRQRLVEARPPARSAEAAELELLEQ